MIPSTPPVGAFPQAQPNWVSAQHVAQPLAHLEAIRYTAAAITPPDRGGKTGLQERKKGEPKRPDTCAEEASSPPPHPQDETRDSLNPDLGNAYTAQLFAQAEGAAELHHSPAEDAAHYREYNTR